MQVILIIASGFWLFVGFILGLWHKDKQIQNELDHWKNEATSTGFLLEDANRRRIELEKENKRLRNWADTVVNTCPTKEVVFSCTTRT